MPLIPDDLKKRLLDNGRFNRHWSEADGRTIDFKPLVKLFNPCGAATWLLSELDPDDPDIAFGLCDLGAGEPELGYVSLAEIEGYKGPLGIGIERDLSFTATQSLTAYAKEARIHRRIIA